MRTNCLILFCMLFGTFTSAQNFDVDTLQLNGDIDKLINIVILGDGYQESELPQFATDAAAFQNALFAELPFSRYRNYFNVFTISVPSNESGAAMNPDSLIDNYFGSTYWYGGIERLLVPVHAGKVATVLANNFPVYDQVIMLVNHTKYGGSGGWISTSSQHSSATLIAIHELGHSFGRLRDEYWAGDNFASERANMTKETDPQLVIWKNWYGDAGVGIYQHCCGGNSALWYRPHEDCRMRYLGSVFCPVCNEALVERIHSLVGSPVLAVEPADSFLTAATFPLRFEITTLQPVPNTLKRNWTLNGVSIASNTDTLWLVDTSLVSGSNFLAVAVEDSTTLLRVDNHANSHLYAIAWEIDYTASGLPDSTTPPLTLDVAIYPNPASEQVQVALRTGVDMPVTIVLTDLNGKHLETKTVLKGQVATFDLKTYSPGMYLLNFYVKERRVFSKQLVKK